MSAQVTITQLPSAGALTGTENVPVVQNGVTVQTTVGAIAGAGALNYPFLTTGSTAGLTQARALTAGTGLSLTDGGAGTTLQVNMTGAAAALNAASTGLLVKTGTNTVATVALSVGSGMAIVNANGVAGNPTISLSTNLQNLSSLSGTGLMTISGATFSQTTITGTANQIGVVNGNSAPVLSLASNAILPGTGGVTVPAGTTAQRAGGNGAFRYNTDTGLFEGFRSSSWTTFGSGNGTVTSASVVSANGFAGTVANSTTTPAITLTTSLTGLLKGNGTAMSAAVSGTDYAPATSGASILFGNGAGGFNNVTVGSGLSVGAGVLFATGGGGGSSSLNAIISATGSANIANGDNPIAWNWAQTTAAQTGFAIGETTASTGGVGSQVLMSIGTVAGSTADPLRVQTQGSDSLRISRTGNVTVTGLSPAAAVAPIITLQGGVSSAAQSGNSGGVVINAGAAGAVASVVGGPIVLAAGAGSTTTTGGVGGAVSISAGAGGLAATGGNLTLSAGVGGATGVGGAFIVNTAATNTSIERLRVLANGAWSVGTGGAATGTSGQVLTSTGATTAPTWQTSAVATLNAITAAGGSATLANGNNPIAWNWTQTTASQTGFAIGETTASTGGAGSQVLFKVGTVAASTADPLQVQARGADVIRVANTGAVTITAGTGTTAVDITAGVNNVSTAGTVTIKGGSSSASSGGGVLIQAGDTGGAPSFATTTVKGATTTGGTAGGTVFVTGGTGNSLGGPATITGGATSATVGTGGAVSITSGAGGTVSGNSGNVNIASGAAAAGSTGNINITVADGGATLNSTVAGILTLQGGNSTKTQVGNSGGVVINGGSALTASTSVNGGPVVITTGSGGASVLGTGAGGAFTVTCGAAGSAGAAVPNTGGAVTITAGLSTFANSGGPATFSAGQGGATGAGGAVTVKAGNSGATSGAGGAANITAGNGVSAVGGDVVLTAGTGSANGSVNFVNTNVANGAVATTLTSVGPTGAATTVQGWLKIKVGGTVRYIPFW